jgi:DNA mismatch repair protein MutL
MSAIRILPEILSNKIAAGEVVERPASVVKELVENALDAQSTRISVEIEKGGRSLIQVSDNGIGLSRDDALLALERYATSKIHREEDLFGIGTLGFRGEALPSIASVSRMTLVTCARGEDVGTEIIIAGGKIAKVSDTGAPPGTLISVRQLFFNTPARRKYLKTVTTEMAHIAEVVTGFALGWPGVHFRLSHNNKVLKTWPAASAPEERVVDVLGREFKQACFRVAHKDDHVDMEGWIASPRIFRTTSRNIHVFVNGRFVRDRMIQQALFQGFSGRLVKGQFPVAVLFIQLPYGEVDVNVHPTKSEVRFLNPKAVRAAIVSAVSQKLAETERPAWQVPDTTAGGASHREPNIAESGKPFARERQTPGVQTRFDQPPDRSVSGVDTAAMQRTMGFQSGNFSPSDPQSKAVSDTQHQLWEAPPDRLEVIGQFRQSYIVCESAGELILIDQHAAHERVLYEQLKKQFDGSAVAAQQLLVPEVIEMAFREANVFTGMLGDLDKFGLEIEHFGQNAFVVKSIPALVAPGKIRQLINELVEKAIDTGVSPGLEKSIDDVLAVMACHGVIRANQTLREPEMRALLEQLLTCDNPSNCPHGRPTWIRWSIRSIEKSFRRVM